MKENLNKFRITYNLKIKKKMNKKTKKKETVLYTLFFIRTSKLRLGKKIRTK